MEPPSDSSPAVLARASATWPSWTTWWSTAGPARGWWPGGRRPGWSSGGRSGSRSTGRGRSPASGPATPGWCWSASPPRAHGGNRTGRIFTGDPSGDVLYASLHRLGLANRPESTWRGDGLRLHGVRITDPVRCAPPENKPTNAERDTCRPWIVREFDELRPTVRAVVALGGFAWQAVLPVLAAAGWRVPRPKPVFGHGAHAVLPATGDGPELHLFGCFHVSPRNTYTGRLTLPMVDDLLRTAAVAAGLDPV